MTFRNLASENPGAKPQPDGLVDLREATSAQLERILGGSASDFAALALTEIEKVIADGDSLEKV